MGPDPTGLVSRPRGDKGTGNGHAEGGRPPGEQGVQAAPRRPRTAASRWRWARRPASGLRMWTAFLASAAPGSSRPVWALLFVADLGRPTPSF